MYSSKHRLDLTNIPQNKLILINPRILVVKYIKLIFKRKYLWNLQKL